MHLLVSLLCLSEGAAGKLASLVGHEVAALVEDQVLQIHCLAGAQLLNTGRRER